MNAATQKRILRVGNGMAWTGLASIGTHLINLARVAVVARMLAPADFGLFGMALVVLLGLSSLGEFGLKEAFIAHDQSGPGERKRWLRAVWTGNLVVKLALACLLLLMAWPAARFYEQPELVPMLAVLTLVPLLTALVNPALMWMEKSIRFGRVAAFELTVAVTGLVATILLAWATGSAWALVLGHVVATAGGVVMSYLIHPFRPRLVWDPEVLRRAMGFGKYMMVTAALTTLINQLDNLIIGAQLGAAALGIYMIAFRIAEIPKLVIGNTTARSLFPYYSETLSEGRDKLAETWQLASGYVIWLILAAYMPIAFGAAYYIVLLFGEQWREAAPILVVLTLLGGMRSFGRTVNSLLMAVHKPNVEALLKSMEVVVFVPAVFIGLAWTGSAIGVAWAAVSSCTFGMLARLAYLLPHMRISPLAYLTRILRPAAGALLMALGGMFSTAVGLHPIVMTGLLWLLWALMLIALEPELRRWLWQRRMAVTEAFA